MHARNRSPINGFRDNAMGNGGVASASQISPESSMRGHGRYNSDYRGYNRGGIGRGRLRQFCGSQPPLLQNGGGDIFREAGRLATEYLVSKGLLPANMLSGKWQNGSLKNLVGAQEGDGAQHPLEGRTSVLSRLGGAGTDTGSDQRRYTDEYNSMGSRSSLGGRRRNGSFENYGFERSRTSMDADDDNDVLSRNWDEQQVSNDGDSVAQNSVPESASENDIGDAKESGIVGGSWSASEKYKSMDDAGAKASASTSEKDLLLKIGKEPVEKDDSKLSNMEAEVTDGGNNDELKLQNTEDGMAVMASSQEGSLASENNCDLLKLSHFVNVPTRMHSSVVVRSSKADAMIVDEDTCECEPPKESGDHDLTVNNLLGDGSLEQTYDLKVLDLDNLNVPAPEDELGLSYALLQQNCTAPVAFPDRSSLKECVLPDFGAISSMTMEHGEKRALKEDNTSMGSKRPRESVTSEDAVSDGHLSLSEPLDMLQTSEEPMTSEGQAVILPPEEKSLWDISLFSKGHIEPCMEYTEEKQLFPGSFKTCDLNLMEYQDTDPILFFSSDTENGEQAIPLDIDLSNHPRASDRYGKCSVNYGIEVIDLENDSAQENKDSDNSDRRTEYVFSGLGGFSNNAQNANDIPDVLDGHGLEISELLGNDVPNCSSAPAGMNHLHNDTCLHNGEVSE